MDTQRQTAPRRPGSLRAAIAAAVILLGSGALAGVGVSNLAQGDLAGGAILTLIAVAMVWASPQARPTTPEA